MLSQLQRAMDELQLMEGEGAAQMKPAYVLEQLPELRAQLSRSVDWHEVADAQRAGALNDTEEEKRKQAASLASMFDMEGIDALIDGGAAAPPKLGYFVELTLRDGDGAEVAQITAESEAGVPLGEQMSFRIGAEQRQRLLPGEATPNPNPDP